MLTRLFIQNYALISQLEISFGSGFTVITGETGAGKSILMGALGLLLGERSDTGSIKIGEQKSIVEASFNLRNLGKELFFADNDIDFDGEECIVRREVNRTGKSRAFINDTPVTLALLKELGTQLVDIHSQHQNLLMSDKDFLLDMIDQHADNGNLLIDYREAYDKHEQARKTLEKLREQAEKDTTERDYLTFQLNQLEEAELKEGEQEELEAEAEKLEHTEEIKSALYTASTNLNGEDSSPVNLLKTVAHRLESIANVFPAAETLAERVDSTRIELEDIADEVDKELENTDFDPERLQFVNERLSSLYSLEKKHHTDSVEELIRKENEIRQRLDLIENFEERIAQTEHEVNQAYKHLTNMAKELSEKRRSSATTLQKQLEEGLHLLGMPHAKTELTLTPCTPGNKGADNVVLNFSANKNVPMRSAADIASGGEIARLMLTLKDIISLHKQLPTIVFDEIDTGVSGTMAEKMAHVMQHMAERCQVVCITHLPQIAACGNDHFGVYKTENETTQTAISHLSEEERVNEIAHMLSGEHVTQAAINNARALLGQTK